MISSNIIEHDMRHFVQWLQAMEARWCSEPGVTAQMATPLSSGNFRPQLRHLQEWDSFVLLP